MSNAITSFLTGTTQQLGRGILPRPDQHVGERARRRIMLHLIPFLFLLYILAYLDRTNVSVAKLQMVETFGWREDVFGFASGLFFWGYWLLEVPSTLSVLRWGARSVFVRILVLWGLMCALTGTVGWLPVVAVSGDTAAPLRWLADTYNWVAAEPKYQFYVYRFMLGFFEGGFFPSVILYLSFWFRAEDRAKAIATFMSAIPMSSVLGLPLSGLMLKIDWLDLEGWRWLYILQGVAPMLAGVATIFCLTDRPEQAKWLPEEERQWLLSELHREAALRPAGHGHAAILQNLGLVLLLTLVYFGLNVSSYGYQFFLPSIIKHQTGVKDDLLVTLLAAPAYGMAFLMILFNGWHSDRTRERIFHVAVPLTCLSSSIALAALVSPLPVVPVLVLVFLAGTFLFAHLPAFWPIPTMFLGSAAAAAAIGTINMLGNMGGFVGPYVMGESAKGVTAAAAVEWAGVGASAGFTAPPNFAAGLIRIAPFPLMSAAIIVVVWLFKRHQMKRD